MPRLVLLCALLIGWFAGSARAQTYRDDTLHWQVSLPGGWRSVPELASEANAAMKARQLEVKFSYIAGFNPTVDVGPHPRHDRTDRAPPDP